MRRLSLVLIPALSLVGCATTPAQNPALTLIVWPKAGSCNYTNPDRSTARTIKYVRLASTPPGPQPTRSVYTTDWSEPFDVPDDRGYCVVMARDIRIIAFQPAILFGFEMHRIGVSEVEITPKLVHVRRPTVASGADGKVAFSALFSVEGGRGGDSSASEELDLGRVGATPANHFNSATRLAWPAAYSRMRVTFTETTH